MQPGKSCPVHYRYRPQQLCLQREPFTGSVLYIVGGLYGNVEALQEILRMGTAEQAQGRSVELVFNGDFNWFNINPDDFLTLNERVLKHTAVLGNVEYEIAAPSNGAGCGCDYPEDVSEAVVARSNRIIQRLQTTAQAFPEICTQLRSLPRFRCYEVEGLKLVVLHGDPESLAGWGLSYDNLKQPAQDAVLADWFRASSADIFACTHTCLPALKALTVDGKPRLVVNNGAAGMGNLRGDPRGLITRIALDGSSHASALFGAQLNHLRVEAVPVAFDQEAWQHRFLQAWPRGSDAYLSYFQRIQKGTHLNVSNVLLGF